jgi:4-diphosphocytidyl-2-C-methyl-D-erythritol kinase
MIRGTAAAKINLALVVGPKRADGRHELVTVYQRVALADRLELRVSDHTAVTGFVGDTLVTSALAALTERRGVHFSARIEKEIPVAAGLGGGSADAAAALRLGNKLLESPLGDSELDEIARELGADVPFFLRDGPQLGAGDGTELQPLDLPQDYWVLLVIPRDASKSSTADVYREFDTRRGDDGYRARRDALVAALDRVRRPRDLAALPTNDLASSPLTEELARLGAFRADVTGAGPAVYGLFLHRDAASEARSRLRKRAHTWLTAPAWYV